MMTDEFTGLTAEETLRAYMKIIDAMAEQDAEIAAMSHECNRIGCTAEATDMYHLHIEIAGQRYPRRGGCEHLVQMCPAHGQEEYDRQRQWFEREQGEKSCRLCHCPFVEVRDVIAWMWSVGDDRRG